MSNNLYPICSFIVAKDKNGKWVNFLCLEADTKKKVLMMSLDGYTDISLPFGRLKYII